MAKKLKKTAKSGDKQLTGAVQASAQQIWQAGLDAFEKTQQEGSKVLSKLAEEGSSLQKRTRKIAEEKAADVSDGFIKISNSVGKQASDSWGKLEQLVEQAVTRSLSNLGLSTQKELLALHKRIDDLIGSPGKSVAKKSPAKKAVKKATAKKAATKTVVPAKKVAAKKTAAKPVSKKKTPAKKATTRSTAAKTSR